MFVVGSPRSKARLAGLFYLLNIGMGAFALFAAGGPGVAAILAAAACYVAVTILFYGLFKPVNRRLSSIAALFSLAGCGVSALAAVELIPSSINPLIFFGGYCLLIGYLILRSTFLPRSLGALMAFGGMGWLTFVSPPLAASLAPYNMAPGILGEGALTVWLLFAGVDEWRWKEQAYLAARKRALGASAV